MNRIEFCRILLNERKKQEISLYSVQKQMGLTFQQAKRIESGENNFNLNKAIDFLAAINCIIKLKKNKVNYVVRDYDSFVKWLVDTRKGMTQRDLATQAGCSYAVIANVEQGRNIISIDVFIKIVEALDYEIQVVSSVE